MVGEFFAKCLKGFGSSFDEERQDQAEKGVGGEAFTYLE